MLKKVQFGEKGESPTINRFKGIKAGPTVISFIGTGEILTAYIHYRNGIGYYHCFNGICCDKDGSPKLKYIIPVVCYHIKDPDTWEIETGLDPSIKYISANDDIYENFIKLNESGVDLNNIDILVETVDEQFQKYQLSPIIDINTGKPREAVWKNDENMRNFVNSFYKNEYQKKIEMSIGKVFKPTEFITACEAAKNNNNNNNAPSSTQGSSRIPQPPAMKDDAGTENSTAVENSNTGEASNEDIPFEGASSEDIEGLYE